MKEVELERLNVLENKINYIGFNLEAAPDFLKDVTPLEYNAPKVYDEKTYKLYRFLNVKDIEILVTKSRRLDELAERYAKAEPLYKYMENNADNGEDYSLFVRMINNTNIRNIVDMEEEQEKFRQEIPFTVKYTNAYKWQIFYDDKVDKYFMLASTDEEDNSAMFYLLKKKIELYYKEKECNEDREKLSELWKDKNYFVYVPICNEQNSERYLKNSEKADIENYLWYFTREWPNTYEVLDEKGNKFIKIVGKTKVFDKMESTYVITIRNKEEAELKYKLIKALFIISYDTDGRYTFEPKISEENGLELSYDEKIINFSDLPDFLLKETVDRAKETEDYKIQNKDLKEDIKELQKEEKEKIEEYKEKEKEIVKFLQCKRTFLGKLKFFFAKKKKVSNKKEDEDIVSIDKDRMKAILSDDKNRYSDVSDIAKKPYTVEDLVNTCKELEKATKENSNIKLDIKALKIKVENLNRKIKNANQYIEEIDKHRKSIFDFWKFANKDEIKALAEGEGEEVNKEPIKKAFDYENDMESLAGKIDSVQREKLNTKEQDAIFATSFILDGINITNKEQLLEEDKEKIEQILDVLKKEYRENILTNGQATYDIFGSLSDDATKQKTLKNTKHRENEKNKFKVLNINNDTTVESFYNSLREISNTLKEESNKITCPTDISLYKASYEKLDGQGFDKFCISPNETLNRLEDKTDVKHVYLYKINVKEGTNIIFYSNIIFFENKNNTLPLGMDISEETLIDLDKYDLELVNKKEFGINIAKDTYYSFIRKIIVYEYNLVDIDERRKTEEK